MGLILCEKKDCDKPLYIEDLNINIYSLEELCYLIYDNPILVMEDFIDRDLFAFFVGFSGTGEPIGLADENI